MIADRAIGTILIVDDDPVLRGLAARALLHAGFEVCEADGGEDGLRRFQERAIDLVLLDVVMPGLDGFEVCTRIRRSERGARVPILMLTGLNDIESIELAYRAGATDFIAKPIHWTLLSHRVRYSLRAGRAQESALRSRERLERAQHIANMGSWEISVGDDRFQCSPELARIFGAPSAESEWASADAFLAQVAAADREVVRTARRAAALHGKAYQLTYRIERCDGSAGTVFEQAVPVYDGAGRQVAVEGIAQDITYRVDTERRITHLAHYDLLTDLPNRQFFAELSGPSLERSRRLGTGAALLHVDVDRFKGVNDAFGHAEGDAVLRTLAERLQDSIRRSDLAVAGRVADEWLVARVGANAFTLLLLDVGDDRDAATAAQRILDVVARPIPMQGQELVLTASVGIALFPRDGHDVTTLARCAEQAVYAAKAAGRAQCRLYDPAMNARASARLTEESELRHAIAGGELRLHYQPKVDATTGRIVGVEALVRWQHRQRGLVLPRAFIPLAEETGLILPLADWVLETACADLAHRREARLRTVPVSVNLASPSFVQDGLTDRLRELLARHRLTADLLTLEVTETLLMTQAERTALRLRELRELGFRISLDDFGTGYSSLSYLKRFPIDEIKIDRSFVIDIGRGERDGKLATSVIALGREFGLCVVAEGVETEAQADFLLRSGCSVQQGFLFAPALAPRDLDVALAGAGIGWRRFGATPAATTGEPSRQAG